MPITPLSGANALFQVIGPQTTGSFKSSGLSDRGKFDTMLNELLKESKLDTKVPPLAAQKVSQVETPSTLIQKVVTQISKSESQLNDLVKMGITGKNLSAQQLLTMQASVYKATIAIDVVSKGVEQTTGGLKTLLQSQV